MPIRSAGSRLTIVAIALVLLTWISAASAFAAPKITSISPAKGVAVGGTSVTISGEGFAGDSTVKFGSTSAASISIKSSTSIVATSPAGVGIVDVSVTNSTGTSPNSIADDFTYQWLGLNTNSGAIWPAAENLRKIDDFTKHNVVYDRSRPLEMTAGNLPSAKLGDRLTTDEGELWPSVNAGMTPIIPIEPPNYNGQCNGQYGNPSGAIPSTTEAIKTYVDGFIKTATAIRSTFPGKTILFEPINEPWCAAAGYEASNAVQYAAIIAKLLPEAKEANIPLNTIYVSATGMGCTTGGSCTPDSWIPTMYSAKPSLMTEVAGWNFHPYGPPTGTFYYDKGGIEAVPNARVAMTSGRNNIIISEIGLCTFDVGNCPKEPNGSYDYPSVANSATAAADLRRVLATANVYYQAGWLKGVLLYSRHAEGWALQQLNGNFTAQGSVLNEFGDMSPSAPGAAPAPNTSPAAADVSEWGGQGSATGLNAALQESVYHGSDHAIWVRYRDEVGGFWRIDRIGGQATEATSPALVRDQPSSKQWVYYRCAANAICQWEWNGSSWSGSTVGGVPRGDSSPAVVRDPATGKRWVYFVNTSGTISQAEWTGSSWAITTPGSSAVRSGTNLTVTRDEINGNRFVYYVNTSGGISQLAWSGSWSNSSVGGAVQAETSPAAVLTGASDRWVYYTSTGGTLNEYHWNGSSWSSSNLGQSLRSGSSPSASTEGGRLVYYVDSQSRIGLWCATGQCNTSGQEVLTMSNPSATFTSATGPGGPIYTRNVTYFRPNRTLRSEARSYQSAGEAEDDENQLDVGPPDYVSTPSVSPAQPQLGIPESASVGTWLGGDAVYVLQWQRCDVGGGNCSDIPTAVGNTYAPVEADLNHTLAVRVDAQNNEGDETVSSPVSGQVGVFVPTYKSSFGSLGSGNGQLNKPTDAAVDASGNIWVADRENNRLEKFNSKGEYVSQLGAKGTGNGQFEKPWAVTIDTSGNIWVADSGNGRVQKFNSKGEFLLKFGSKGSGNGQFSSYGPKGIAADSSGTVWVTDYSGRIQKFNAAGEFQAAVGSKGSGNGQFQQSAGIDIGPEGKIWVSDWEANRVQVFNSAGEFVFKFGSVGSANGQFSHPEGLEVDTKGNVWVSEEGNSRVQQFNQAGEYVTKFGASGSGEGQFKLVWPFSLTSDDNGNLWIPDVNNNRVQRWTIPSYVPTYKSSFGSWGSGNGQLSKPADAAIDASGNVWVADRENNRLEKFNAKGEYVSQLGSKGTGNGQFEKPWAVTIDASGNIWVADSGNGRVQKFNSKGEFLLKFGSQGSGNGQFSIDGPKGIATDSSGNAWVTDYSGRIQKFNAAGEFQAAVGSKGSGNGQFQQSAGIDIGPEGKIWVSDWEANRVQVFNSKGEFLFKFGSLGTGNGQFNYPDGLEVDAKGNVWVGEEGNSRVQQFNQFGEYVTKFGAYGSGAGQFIFGWPFSLTSDDNGNLWIPDVENNRVQRWTYAP